MHTITPLRERQYFTAHKSKIALPNLVEVQKKSYDWFFKEGLRELFDEISPIADFIGRDLELYFQDFYLDEPKFDERTSRAKNLTYEAPLRVNVKMVNKRTKEEKVQEVYLGDFPIMTPRGTFLINGVERVVVSQLIRSAGVFFTSEVIHERRYYGAKVIPNRGAWLEFETDQNDVMWVKIDRKRKVAVTALLRAFGISTDEEIKSLFKEVDTNEEHHYIEATLAKDISTNMDEGLIEIYKRIRPGDLATADNAKSLIYSMFFRFERYDFGRVGRYKVNKRFGFDIANTKDNRVLRREDIIEVIREIIRLNSSQAEADDIDHLGNRRVRAIGELVQNKLRVGLARMERLIKDRMSTMDMAGLTPTKLINARPVIGVVKEFFMSSQLTQFMDQINPLAELEHKRRLSAMGPGGLSRERAGFEVRDVHRTHYGRICPIATPEGPNIGLVGHLASYARVNDYGFIQTSFLKVIHDVMAADFDKLEGEIARTDIVDAKGHVLVTAGDKIKKTDITKIKKAEIASVAVKPRVTGEAMEMDAFETEKYVATQATAPIDENGYFLVDRVEARRYGKPEMVPVEQIDLMDVSAQQIISIATSMVPFLEHNDAVRALMGSNMQRQAVSTITPHAPYIGTGIEFRAAYDSGQVQIASEAGTVTDVQGSKIEITREDNTVDTYMLTKFQRSNASSCLNQRPIVSLGQKVDKGAVLSDGPSIEGGELALGQNVFVAYMPWHGQNYEDAIIVSERLIQEDTYSSIHIEDKQIEIRDTKLGPEMVTCDIPNVSEEKLRNLGPDGIVRLGTKVTSGDILVGKITPKGETELSAEEKLLRVLFGEKAKDVRDSSLYMQHGEQGKVVDVKIFSREAGDKLSPGVIKMIQVSIATLRKIQVGDKMAGRHGNKGVISKVVPVEDMPYTADGRPVDIILSALGVISRMNLGQLLEAHLGLAAQKLGYYVATPSLAGITEDTIKEELKKAGYPEDGKVQLYDGKTGEAFDNKTMIGVAYMLKLNHMVDDKIHQRSIGPYSLITQQPLGGRAQFGGQRFGEMEVWALEGYGAAHTLQELLTIKSDDVPGRSKAYEAIIKGDTIEKRNIPESFNVLVRELKGLCLDVELMKKLDEKNFAKVDLEKDTKKSNEYTPY